MLESKIKIHEEQKTRAVYLAECAGKKVITFVREIRMIKPSLERGKLYYMLNNLLLFLKVGRDKLYRILRADHMLIIPESGCRITTGYYHILRKYKILISTIEIDKSD